MNCKKFDELIEKNLIDDKPMTTLSDEMREHIEFCEACKDAYVLFERVERSFAEVQNTELPKEFHGDLMKSIALGKKEEKSRNTKIVKRPTKDTKPVKSDAQIAKPAYVSPLIKYKKFGAIAAMFLIFAVSYAVYDYAFKDSYNYMEPVVGDFGMKSEPKVVSKQAAVKEDRAEDVVASEEGIEMAMDAKELTEESAEMAMDGKKLTEESVEIAKDGLEEAVKREEIVELAVELEGSLDKSDADYGTDEVTDEKSVDEAMSNANLADAKEDAKEEFLESAPKFEVSLEEGVASEEPELAKPFSSYMAEAPSPEEVLSLLLDYDKRLGNEEGKVYTFEGEEGEFYIFSYLASEKVNIISVDKLTGNIYVEDELLGNIYGLDK